MTLSRENKIPGTNRKMIFRDYLTRKKVKRHLSDINDKITDQDIENIKTDVTPNTIVEDGKEFPVEGEAEKKIVQADNEEKSDDDERPGMITPWDILGSK